MRLAIQPYTLGNTSAGSPDAATPLGYNYDMLDEQEGAQKQFPQLLAEIKNLRQQVSEQRHNNVQLQRQCESNSTAIQKMQLGMNIRDQAHNNGIRRLKQELAQRQTTTDSGRQQLTEQGSSSKDPVWEQSLQHNDHWQSELHRTGRMPVPERQPQAIILVYAMAAITEIAKAIDECVDDYGINGGTIADRNVINGHLVVDWGVRMRIRLDERGITIKDKGINAINNKIGTTTMENGKSNVDGYKIPLNAEKRLLYTPSQESSHERDIGDFNNLHWHSLNDGDDGDEPGGDYNDDSNGARHTEDDNNYQSRHRAGGDNDRAKEFSFVNPRNITIFTFTSKSLQTNPYLTFSNQLRRLILTMGADGEDLLELLDLVEKRGKYKVSKQLLINIAKEYPKIYEYDRSIKATLLNWASGVAQGLVKHDTEGGLDAWRKLYHKYVPSADDLQNIIIRQLMSIRQVGEADVDSLFDEIECIRELYVKAGSDEEPMNERWLKAAVLQNLPDTVLKNLAIELKKAASIEGMYSMISTFTFDHRTGLPRGQASPMLYLTEGPTLESAKEIPNVNGDKIQDKDTHNQADKKT